VTLRTDRRTARIGAKVCGGRRTCSRALAQNDETMQPPMLADVGMYVWKIKETQAPESDLPEWGSLPDRGIAWEAVTAASFIIAGAELLIMRHHKAAESVEKFIAEMEG
jgi:acetyl-CoA decarbonylase/synthase complex subunit delta